MKGVLSRRSRKGRSCNRCRTKSPRMPKVFAVHKSETHTGRYHEVLWANDGNLNAAQQRGDIKRFRRWGLAGKFAKDKAKTLGIKATIS